MDWQRFQASQQSADQQGQGKQLTCYSIYSCNNGGKANAILKWIDWRYTLCPIHQMNASAKRKHLILVMHLTMAII